MSKGLTARPKAGGFASTEAEKRSVTCLQYHQTTRWPTEMHTPLLYSDCDRRHCLIYREGKHSIVPGVPANGSLEFRDGR